MCDDAWDVTPAAVWNEHVVRAAKSHRCSGCNETIGNEHSYRRTAVLGDGGWSTWKHCLRCAALIDALKSKMGEWTTALLDLNCGRDWTKEFGDLPPHIEALAFLLPGELPGAS